MSDDRMIFVSGASRSGTTLMSFILRNHPQVHGLRESHFFGGRHVSRQLDRPLGYDDAVQASAWFLARQEKGVLGASPAPIHVERAMRIVRPIPEHKRTTAGVFIRTARVLCRESGKPIPCEQTPRNVFFARELLDAYPNARFVHMMRDPRAVMASQKKRWQRRRLAKDAGAISAFQSIRVWMNYHPYTMADLWRRASRAASRLSGHPRFNIVRYEDLLDSPERTMKNLCSDLKLDFDPDMLEVEQVNSSHQSSLGGARRGIYKEAADSWLATLSDTESAIVERSCGTLMDHFGYQRRRSDGRGPSRYAELRFRLTYPWHAAGVFLVNPRRALEQLQAAFRRHSSASF